MMSEGVRENTMIIEVGTKRDIIIFGYTITSKDFDLGIKLGATMT